jgi:hypothetical protein
VYGVLFFCENNGKVTKSTFVISDENFFYLTFIQWDFEKNEKRNVKNILRRFSSLYEISYITLPNVTQIFPFRVTLMGLF